MTVAERSAFGARRPARHRLLEASYGARAVASRTSRNWGRSDDFGRAPSCCRGQRSIGPKSRFRAQKSSGFQSASGRSPQPNGDLSPDELRRSQSGAGAWRERRRPRKRTNGSYLASTTRSFIGMMPLSVILMCSGQTSVQHLVMLQ